MHRLLRQSSLVLALAAALSSPAAAEDLTIVSTVTPSKGKPGTSTQYITAGKVRTSDGRTDTIMDVASGRMIHIDHKKKQYYETSLEELRAAMAGFDEMLRTTPMLGKMFGAATEVQVEKGSGSREVAGYTCRQYFMTIGKSFAFELWTTPEIKPPIAYYDASKMVYAAMGPIATRFDKMFEEMKKLEGIALLTKLDTKVMGMDLSSVSEATEVRRGPIPSGTFDPPAGYKRKKSPHQQK